jgi:putative endonuclease
MNKRNTGNSYEDLACEYLEGAGCRLIKRNFSCRSGEIDIIFKDKDYLVFAEVKYRSSEDYGRAEEAVNYTKQKKICRVSDFYRYINKIGEYDPVRFDVIAVENMGEKTTVHWYQNAFDYIPGRKK